ncbi:MAG: DUF4097 family beta strand repeat-containing protein [Christensenellaceae bacterium]
MKNTKTAVKTTILIIIVAVLIVVMIWGIGYGGGMWEKFSGMRFSFGGTQLPADAQIVTEFETDRAGIKKISLDYASEDIKVVKGSEKSIKIVQTSDRKLEEKHLVKNGIANGTIESISGLKNQWIAWNTPKMQVTVTLPADFEGELVIGTQSGTVQAEVGIQSQVKINTMSGSISLIGGKNIEANSTSGTITALKSTGENLKCETMSGDIAVKDAVVEMMEADSVSGGIFLSGDVREVKANAVSGNIDIDIKNPMDIDVESTSGEIEAQVKDASLLNKIDMNSISGTVQISLPENDGFTVDFESISGDMDNDFGEAVYKNGMIKIKVDTTSSDFDLKRVS